MRRFALLSALLLGAAGCGGGRTISLATLAAKQQAYNGKRVETSGTVRRERDADGATYYVLGDAAGDLVGLRPPGEARRYAGDPVVVTGVFRIVPGFGRALRISSIRRG